ncbi:SAM-dependent methyltransferase [Moraxella nasovis]|uniref:N-6 DNA methylase n=1 Tax=Moraxella nasovis TaxID=2904121 RepID=UPI001F60AA72|nr:N-6 DNA methylase [Moraxella nasovis]UNU74123.1 SAM-dependent methyltransferase [Moraxella nasovis]
MKEHNNRKIAKAHAEFITGQALRQYVADKVKQYVGDSVSVFDGAVGSGQLEQHISPKHVYGVEIQDKACEVFLDNYPNSKVYHGSFFDFNDDHVADCVVMNPPFSIKFKELSDSERTIIQSEFTWKKSGVVDDIFVLKSLKHTKRYGFYILSAGVGYRATEKTFRTIIGNRLAECSRISNAFDDTAIDVLFFIIDKQKTDDSYQSEFVDFKTGEIYQDTFKIDPDRWETANKPTKDEWADFDINKINDELDDLVLKKLENSLQNKLLISQLFNPTMNFLAFIDKIMGICEKFKKQYEMSK